MNVLIVDDEPYILEYLQHLIDWKRFGFREVLTTNHPQQVLQFLQERMINLVISDIRMPEISGLDLLKTISQSYPKTKVMFLSGYSDFEYAKTGLQYGAEDYLLKPITKLELEVAIQGYLTKYGLNKVENDERQEDQLNWLITKIGFFDSNESDNDNLISNQKYVFFKQNVSCHAHEPVIVLWSEQNLSFGFLPYNQQKILDKACVSDSFQFDNRDELRQVFYAFFMNQMYHHEELSKVLLIPALQRLKGPECSLSLFEEGYQEAEGVEKYIYLMECLTILLRHQITLQPKILLNGSQPEIFKNKVVDYLRILIDQAKDKNLLNRVIEKVNQYIEKNLSENLTLEVVANKVYVHPAYLSKLYKQETGENFSSYLSNKRMEAAAELLIESNLMVSDIGKMVGYRTSQYFIKIFKEKYQMTPQQYRRAHL